MEKVILNFLIKIEKIALDIETEITRYKEEDEQYKYLNDLLGVIKSSKLAFATLVVTSNEDKRKQLMDRIKRLGMTTTDIELLLTEANNLYQLNKNGIVGDEDVRDQKEKAEEVIERFSDKITESIQDFKYLENEKEIQDLRKYLEKIVSLGSVFEEDTDSVIEDIDFFEQTLSKLGIPFEEQDQLIRYALDKNVENYMKNIKIKKEEKAVIDLDKGIENEESDLLRMLTDNEEEEVLEEVKHYL